MLHCKQMHEDPNFDKLTEFNISSSGSAVTGYDKSSYPGWSKSTIQSGGEAFCEPYLIDRLIDRFRDKVSSSFKGWGTRRQSFVWTENEEPINDTRRVLFQEKWRSFPARFVCSPFHPASTASETKRREYKFKRSRQVVFFVFFSLSLMISHQWHSSFCDYAKIIISVDLKSFW